MINVGIVGATGYTGSELLRLLRQHPNANVVYATSEQSAGKPVTAVHPQIDSDLVLEPFHPEEAVNKADFFFCALPHGSSQEVVPALIKSGKPIVDLSADFRLAGPDVYSQWYRREHIAAELLPATYGLPELWRDQINNAQLVANPGCYPTAVLLALAPLAGEGLIQWRDVVVDAKSGMSGSGKKPTFNSHLPYREGNFEAYKVGSHQHTPEIEQQLSILSGKDISLIFVPHLVPMSRGILVTAYLRLTKKMAVEKIEKMYHSFYQGEPFIRLLSSGLLPATGRVRGSNYCELSLVYDQRTDRMVIISAIDNLVKGAAGQAVQNMNIICKLPETMGLEQLPLFP